MRMVLLAAACLLVTVPARNPAFLRATQVLARRQPGEAPRVRFQWERVPGATEYLLKGSWAAGRGWALNSKEYRVTAASATVWGPELITYEVSLPAGDHSWTVVALARDPATADFATPARLSFRLE